MDVSPLVRRAETEFVVASDVTNPLLGPTGAASVYAPQNGAHGCEVVRLDRGLDNLVQVVDAGYGNAAALAGSPGAGAAGGIRFAALLIGARMTWGPSTSCDSWVSTRLCPSLMR